MVHLSDIHSVTDFQRNTKDHLKRLEKSRRPLVLTLNGKAKAVVIDAQSYDELMEKVEQAKTVEAVGEGLEDVKRGPRSPRPRFSSGCGGSISFLARREVPRRGHRASGG